jgi:hypothetical protein
VVDDAFPVVVDGGCAAVVEAGGVLAAEAGGGFWAATDPTRARPLSHATGRTNDFPSIPDTPMRHGAAFGATARCRYPIRVVRGVSVTGRRTDRPSRNPNSAL